MPYKYIMFDEGVYQLWLQSHWLDNAHLQWGLFLN